MTGTKDSFSYGKRSSFLCKTFSLFLLCNMAAAQNLYSHKGPVYTTPEKFENGGFTILVHTKVVFYWDQPFLVGFFFFFFVFYLFIYLFILFYRYKTRTYRSIRRNITKFTTNTLITNYKERKNYSTLHYTTLQGFQLIQLELKKE